jgi:putative colanic acid biosynthesis acetyltransferase WcaF
MSINLSKAGKGNYSSEKSFWIQAIWFIVEAAIIDNRIIANSTIRTFFLRLFGAKIGKGCVCPHAIRVKYPWKLTIGDRVWLGDGIWIYNQDKISIGSDVCISQRTFLTCGSHEYKSNMDLKVAPITIEDGVWISAMCVIQMGVTIGRDTLITPLSVVHRSLAGNGIYSGNPCKQIGTRFPDNSQINTPHQTEI